MNTEYIYNQLKKEQVPEEIINDAVFFLENYGWRKGPNGAIYILGLERTHIDYYWICVDKTMTLKYISVCCDISRYLLDSKDNEDGKLEKRQVEDIQHKIEKANSDREVEEILIWLFNYNVSGDTFRGNNTETEEKKNSLEDIKKIIIPTGKVVWNKDLLNGKQKNILMDYAISKLNEVEPLTIKLSQLETLRYEDFCHRHRNCVSGKFGATGGGISLKITGTGLGWCFDCVCNGCGATEDITDISNW